MNDNTRDSGSRGTVRVQRSYDEKKELQELKELKKECATWVQKKKTEQRILSKARNKYKTDARVVDAETGRRRQIVPEDYPSVDLREVTGLRDIVILCGRTDETGERRCFLPAHPGCKAETAWCNACAFRYAGEHVHSIKYHGWERFQLKTLEICGHQLPKMVHNTRELDISPLPMCTRPPRHHSEPFMNHWCFNIYNPKCPLKTCDICALATLEEHLINCAVKGFKCDYVNVHFKPHVEPALQTRRSKFDTVEEHLFKHLDPIPFVPCLVDNNGFGIGPYFDVVVNDESSSADNTPRNAVSGTDITGAAESMNTDNHGASVDNEDSEDSTYGNDISAVDNREHDSDDGVNAYDFCSDDAQAEFDRDKSMEEELLHSDGDDEAGIDSDANEADVEEDGDLAGSGGFNDIIDPRGSDFWNAENDGSDSDDEASSDPVNHEESGETFEIGNNEEKDEVGAAQDDDASVSPTVDPAEALKPARSRLLQFLQIEDIAICSEERWQKVQERMERDSNILRDYSAQLQVCWDRYMKHRGTTPGEAEPPIGFGVDSSFNAGDSPNPIAIMNHMLWHRPIDSSSDSNVPLVSVERIFIRDYTKRVEQRSEGVRYCGFSHGYKQMDLVGFESVLHVICTCNPLYETWHRYCDLFNGNVFFRLNLDDFFNEVGQQSWCVHADAMVVLMDYMKQNLPDICCGVNVNLPYFANNTMEMNLFFAGIMPVPESIIFSVAMQKCEKVALIASPWQLNHLTTVNNCILNLNIPVRARLDAMAKYFPSVVFKQHSGDIVSVSITRDVRNTGGWFLRCSQKPSQHSCTKNCQFVKLAFRYLCDLSEDVSACLHDAFCITAVTTLPASIGWFAAHGDPEKVAKPYAHIADDEDTYTKWIEDQNGAAVNAVNPFDVDNTEQHQSDEDQQHQSNEDQQHQSNEDQQHQSNEDQQHQSNEDQQHQSNEDQQHQSNEDQQHQSDEDQQHQSNEDQQHQSNEDQQHQSDEDQQHQSNEDQQHQSNEDQQHQSNEDQQHQSDEQQSGIEVDGSTVLGENLSNYANSLTQRALSFNVSMRGGILPPYIPLLQASKRILAKRSQQDKLIADQILKETAFNAQNMEKRRRKLMSSGISELDRYCPKCPSRPVLERKNMTYRQGILMRGRARSLEYRDAKVRIHFASGMVFEENVKLFIKACPNCTFSVLPTGLPQGLFLVTHTCAFDVWYLQQIIESITWFNGHTFTTCASQYKTTCMILNPAPCLRKYNKYFRSYTNMLIRASYSYLVSLGSNLERANRFVECDICEDNPRILVCDGNARGIRKSLFHVAADTRRVLECSCNEQGGGQLRLCTHQHADNTPGEESVNYSQVRAPFVGLHYHETVVMRQKPHRDLIERYLFLESQDQFASEEQYQEFTAQVNVEDVAVRTFGIPQGKELLPEWVSALLEVAIKMSQVAETTSYSVCFRTSHQVQRYIQNLEATPDEQTEDVSQRELVNTRNTWRRFFHILVASPRPSLVTGVFKWLELFDLTGKAKPTTTIQKISDLCPPLSKIILLLQPQPGNGTVKYPNSIKGFIANEVKFASRYLLDGDIYKRHKNVFGEHDQHYNVSMADDFSRMVYCHPKLRRKLVVPHAGFALNKQGKADDLEGTARDKKKRGECTKIMQDAKGITAGLFVVTCAHGICYFVAAVKQPESPRFLFELLVNRFNLDEELLVLYDNGCNALRYFNKRAPWLFRNVRVFIDRLHQKNHSTRCSELFDLDKVGRRPEEILVNSQGAEQLNNRLKNLSVLLASTAPSGSALALTHNINKYNEDRNAFNKKKRQDRELRGVDRAQTRNRPQRNNR